MSKTFKSEGIIFRSLPYSETSLILDIYTQEYGLGSYIVSGVRKSKSTTINIYHPINIVNIVAYIPKENLSRIKEAGYAFRYQSLQSNVIRGAVATFYIDLLRTSIKEKEANLSLYMHIIQQLKILDNPDYPLHNIPIQLMIQLATYLGFGIQDNFSKEKCYFDLKTAQYIPSDLEHSYILHQELSTHLHLLMHSNFEATIPKQIRQILLDKLILFYKIHIENFKDLRSLPILRTLLS